MARGLPLLAWRPGPLEKWFIGVMLASLALRLYELTGRTMHYDEAIHLYYAWEYARGEGFQHSPWMHGPFQVELVAAFLKFIGDSTFIARLPYALFGTALVGMPWLLREQLGRYGAVAASALMAASPVLLYFSRFGRNDIIMAVGATMLLACMWRYVEDGRRRHLLAAAAAAAVMLASKETAYFILLYFGVAAAILGWRPLLGVMRSPRTLPSVTGPAGFFILIGALAAPHAAAVLGIGQGLVGLELVAPEDGAHGDTGAPAWMAPFLDLPVAALPTIVNYGALAAGASALAWFFGACSGPRGRFAALPRPPLRVAALGALGFLTLGLAWTLLFVEGGLAATVGAVLPASLGVNESDLAAGLLAVNFAVALGAMLALALGGAVVGILWNPRAFLPAAGIFYAIWVSCYTTFFANAGGIFTGSWQSLGYWIAQQEVARGNQPWYYYVVGLTVYDLAAFAFGVAASVWLLRRRQSGMDFIVAGWVLASLATYTIATEKMPWLMVNLVVPLSLAAGMMLGRMAETVPWRALTWRHWAGLAGVPAALCMLVWLGWQAAGGDALRLVAWTALLALAPALALLWWSLRRRATAWCAAGLGVAALLVLTVSVPGALRGAYIYDDSRVEMLVFAQGSADLWRSYQLMRQNGLLSGQLKKAVGVDWELWFPMQWYTRHDNLRDTLEYGTKCNSGQGCDELARSPHTRLYLSFLGNTPDEAPEGFERSAIRRNLLWHPETYRRPGEQRTSTSMPEQLKRDFRWFGQVATDPAILRDALEYVLARDMRTDWFRSEYYHYTSTPLR